MDLDEETGAAVASALASTRPPVIIDRGRIERQLRDLALDHAAGKLSDAEYLVRQAQLRSELSWLHEKPRVGMTAERALEWLATLAETWQHADVPEAKAELLHAIYERIVVAGREIVSARLTPAAYEHGLALALPEEVQVAMARPAGFGRALTTCRIAIDGRADWLAARDPDRHESLSAGRAARCQHLWLALHRGLGERCRHS